MYEFRTGSRCKYDPNDRRCVEVATNVPGVVAVRNSNTGNVQEYSPQEWAVFIEAAKAGEFDLTA
ncbi:DUF397 domain-containing protein [Yinghuangia soli]|uniref:DUF397 domain-containing protein n=1 Tax=Yinghuangia soli TaxID=2908204 RepID=A0AA41PZ24_9ACTN|nr:DUF397 domain-containing protein [Yinghuangia soli]MCF2528423.1 DUF397 domain-containing protein [Yinghuangia soli]